MPTVDKKYTTDAYAGKHDFQGNHDVYDMPENLKPKERPHVTVNPRTVVIILLLLLFLGFVSVAVYEILKQAGAIS